MEASRTAQSAAVCPSLNGSTISGHGRPDKWSHMPLSQRQRSRVGRLKARQQGLPHLVLASLVTMVTPDSSHPTRGLESPPLRPAGVHLAPGITPHPPPPPTLQAEAEARVFMVLAPSLLGCCELAAPLILGGDKDSAAASPGVLPYSLPTP